MRSEEGSRPQAAKREPSSRPRGGLPSRPLLGLKREGAERDCLGVLEVYSASQLQVLSEKDFDSHK